MTDGRNVGVDESGLAAGTITQGGSSGGTVRHSHWLDRAFLLGLSALFLVNAAVAALDPADFVALVQQSRIDLVMPAHVLGPLIAVNDALLGVSLVLVTRFQRLRTGVLAWAGLWLLAVSVVKLSAMGPG